MRAIIAEVFDALEPASMASNIETLRKGLDGLDQKIARLTGAIEAGAPPAPVVAQLHARQTEREGLLKAIAAAEAISTRLPDRASIEQKVLAKVAQWRALLTRQISDSRQCLREVLEGPLRFTPDGRGYRFEGEVVTGRLIAGLVGLPTSMASQRATRGCGTRRSPPRCETPHERRARQTNGATNVGEPSTVRTTPVRPTGH